MSTLISHINDPSQANYGVNILDRPAQPVVTGQDVATIGFVGVFPWGPFNTVTEIRSVAEFYATFAPVEFGDRNSYASLKAVLNKVFPSSIQVLRVLPSSSAPVAASITDDDEDSTESTVITAKYASAQGNRIKRTWTANATTAANRDLQIQIVDSSGNVTYTSPLYENVAVASPLAVTDPGDPWVTVTTHANFVKVPDAAASAALASGTDGTTAAADWAGGAGTYNGIKGFRDLNLGVDVIFGAEVPQAHIPTFNEAGKAVAEEVGAVFITSTIEGDAYTDAIGDAALVPSIRVVKPWPKVYTTNGYDPNLGTVLVDGNAFAAVAVASVPPWDSPGGAPGAPYLTGITGLETSIGIAEYEALRDGGVSAFRNSRANGGYIMNGGVVTQIADTTRLAISRTRMFDYITSSVGVFMERFVGRLADINLTQQAFGPVTRQQKAGVDAFLAKLKSDQVIEDYQVDWFSGNTALQLAAGRFVVQIRVRQFGSQDEIIIDAAIGQFVDFSGG